eukprot:CAMPEP_0168472158 /NCGR_PEP_ID=MMETSP0228-20121227/59657_1 /TAXON_ID=133427 /ORGANISM="Protoceratium reticulatum, Strain CCCM 535 (=CCMP 1889)" /LENGTH=47 /DNA_ID= /DNA_START= /DNA_END= /DNA_ORIENTATION=
MTFTMVIPDSFDIVVHLGGGAVSSGVLIGAHKFGTAAGALALYVMLA